MAFYNVRLINNANGNLTLIWTEVVDNGPANIFAMVYDPATQSWSSDRRLTENQALAHDVSGYYSGDGKLNLAYLATEVTRTTDTVVIDGQSRVIPNIPNEGRTDLQLLSHSLLTDLSVRDSDLILNAGSPQEGDVVSGTLTVHNAGDFTVGNFVVKVYAGEPSIGNVLTSIVVADTLRAGEQRTLPFTFTMPADGSIIVAIIDANNAVSEFSELNNRATFYVNNTAPQARVTANVIGGPAALTVNFDASGSFDLEGDAIAFTWAFADGSESATGAKVSHLFNQAGTYAVTLTASDSKGAVSVAVVQITVTTPAIEVFLDQSGTDLNRAAAVDSVLFLKDPFPVVNPANYLNKSLDKNTRVIIFVTNVQLAQGETASSVVVNLTDQNNQSYDIAAEDVRTVPNLSFTQIIFRLPDNLPNGTCVLKVKAHNQSSNIGTIRIKN
jgi:PKD repeat protein